MTTVELLQWIPCCFIRLRFFFFNDTATTEIYTLSLHDALPIFQLADGEASLMPDDRRRRPVRDDVVRSEDHTSELQSRPHLVCRLLLEKKKLQLYLRCGNQPA